MLLLASCEDNENDNYQLLNQLNFTETELYHEVELSYDDYADLLKNTHHVYLLRAGATSFEYIHMGLYNIHRIKDEAGVTHYYFRMISLTPMINKGDELYILN